MSLASGLLVGLLVFSVVPGSYPRADPHVYRFQHRTELGVARTHEGVVQMFYGRTRADRQRDISVGPTTVHLLAQLSTHHIRRCLVWHMAHTHQRCFPLVVIDTACVVRLFVVFFLFILCSDPS